MSSTWISGLNALAAAWGENMARACWQGGLLVLIVWALCRLLPRIPASLRCLLWWLACLRLLIGLSAASIPLALLSPAPRPLIQAVMPTLPSGGSGKISREALSLSHSGHAEKAEASAAPASAAVSLSSIMFCLWMGGVLAFLGATLFPLRPLRRLLVQAQPLDDLNIQQMAVEAAGALGLRTLPQLLITQAEVGPVTFGLLHPVVLFSQGDLARLSDSELRLVLAHEFAHIRRGDIWLGLLPYLTQILFFFHPLVWMARREFDVAREAACDSRVLLTLQATPDAYANLLLKLGMLPNTPLSRFTLGVSSHFHTLQRRIKMLPRNGGHPRDSQGIRAILFFSLIGLIGLVPWRLVKAQTPLLRQEPKETLFAQSDAAQNRKAGDKNSRPEDPITAGETVTIELDGTNLPRAIALIFDKVHADYVSSLYEDTDNSLSARIKQTPLEQALDVILRSVGNTKPALHQHTEHGIVSVVQEEFPNQPFIKSRKVSFRFQRTDLRAALDTLFATQKIAYRLKEPLTAKVTASAKGLPFPEALDAFLQQCDPPLKAVREKDVTILTIDKTRPTPPQAPLFPTPAKPHPSEPAANPNPGTVHGEASNKSGIVKSLDLNHVELGAALQEVFSLQSGNYILVEPVDAKRKITLKLQNISVKDAVERLQRMAEADPPLFYQEIRGIQILNRPRVPGLTQDRLDKTQLTLALNDVSAYEALYALFSTTQANFALAGELKNIKLTVGMIDTPFRQAVEKIMDASPTPLKWTLQDGVYKVELK